MALSETSWTADSASKAAAKRYSKGAKHSQHIKLALRAKRLAGKHVPAAIERLAKAMESESNSEATPACVAILNRAIGLPASAPEDQAVALAIAHAMPGDFLTQLLNMRLAAQQLRTIEAPVEDATLVDIPKPMP